MGDTVLPFVGWGVWAAAPVWSGVAPLAPGPFLAPFPPLCAPWGPAGDLAPQRATPRPQCAAPRPQRATPSPRHAAPPS
ncbi:hypothetical protein GCM10018785_52220 [Streptomyces longispororuber]|uniref:Uncharacterized protein n=1 Tax=Streptomyces longispororuber TaxID=68230 RepID=A0A919DS37_9ACTN|nr:hypothetical protein GCM10018785_52220 [Streptomyces longispororuber]